MTIEGAIRIQCLLSLIVLRIGLCHGICDQITQTSECICEGSEVTFQCAVTGGVSTQWQVSTCEITLPQTDIDQGTARQECLNSRVIGNGIRNDSNCYISSLTISDIQLDLINETVWCLVDDGLQTHQIDNATITLTDIINPAPQNLRQLENWPFGELAVIWDSVLENCSAIQYNIISTELCGVCPTTVAQNMLICINVTGSGLCNITVETVGCNINDERERTNEISVRISVEPVTTQSSEEQGNPLNSDEIAAIVVVPLVFIAIVVLVAILVAVIICRRCQMPRNKRTEYMQNNEEDGVGEVTKVQETNLDDQRENSKRNSSRDEVISSPLLEDNDGNGNAPTVFAGQAGDTYQLRNPNGTGERPVSKRYSLLLLNPTKEELGGESDVKEKLEEVDDKLTKVEENKSESEPIKTHKELIDKKDKKIAELVNERRELKKKVEDYRTRLATAEKRSKDRAEEKIQEILDSFQETMERERSKSISQMKEMKDNEAALQNEIRELKTQISAITPLLNEVLEKLGPIQT